MNKYAVCLLLALLGAFSCVYGAEGDIEVRNKVVFVDENGQTNAPEVLADIAAQATNEVSVLIAAEKAEAAKAAADEVSSVVGDLAANIVKNEVRVFRKGSLSSFSPLIIFDPEKDKLVISAFVPSQSSISIGYVCTVDVGSFKPIVRASDTLATPQSDWIPLADSVVSAPILHDEQVTQDGITFDKWYEITIPNPTTSAHFYTIEMDPDTPDGDGLTLDIVGGITGGVTGVFEIGSKTYTFKGGLLMGVE